MNKNYIGENIRIYRERKNLTQRELADRIGKTWEMVSRYERGTSSALKQAEKIATVLNIEIEDLLRDPGKKKSEFSFNRVPLFTVLPKHLDFKNTKSYIYYTVPDWVLDIDRECFVVDNQIVEIDITELDKTGYLYVSPNSVVNTGDIVLINENGKAILKRYQGENREDLIGKILSQEIIFE